MGNRILFVCHANECRSPVMAGTMIAALEGAGRQDEWRVSSGGTDSRGGPLCPVAIDVLADAMDAALLADYRDHFVSTAIAERTLERADLILTATREERAAIALRAPAARSRTFTLREAIGLMAGDGESAVDLAAYADILHERRGLTGAASHRRFLALRKSNDPNDIPDVHHAALRAHRAGLQEVREASRVLASGILAAIGE
jgi:protein-tyrosine phosphatase